MNKGWSVSIDEKRCKGYACCVMALPEVFEMDRKKGIAIVTQETPDDALRSKVEVAARSCPVRAVIIHDS